MHFFFDGFPYLYSSLAIVQCVLTVLCVSADPAQHPGDPGVDPGVVRVGTLVTEADHTNLGHSE